MIPLLHDNLKVISEICKKHHVLNLHVFGSASTGTYVQGISDIDFVVVFDPKFDDDIFEDYFGLVDSLKDLLNAEVDLVTARSVKNPYILQSIERERKLLYAA